MKTSILATCLLFFSSLNAQIDYFPPLLGNEWDTLSMSDLGWCEDQLDELLDYLEENNTKAFLILKDGKIVVEQYFGDTEMASNLPWNSAGKTITAMMIGIAQENDLLSIQDKTSDYLGTGWTSLPPEQEDSITIWNQLTMTSGLDDATGFCVTPECLTYSADAGTQWAYHNGAYTLLQDVIESASGATMNNYTFLNLRAQTGIDGAFIPLLTNKVFFGPARGMARMGSLMLNHGTWNNTVVLGDMDYFDQMINPSQDINQAYGYLWWLNGFASFMLPGSQVVFPGSLTPNAPADLYSGLGKNGQFMDVVPGENIVVVRMGDSPDGSFVPVTFHNEMWEYISAVICESTAVEETVFAKNSQVFPNPFKTTFQIEATFEIKKIRLYNSLGQLVLEEDNTNQISGVQLPAGVYLLGIFDKNGRRSLKRIIKE